MTSVAIIDKKGNKVENLKLDEKIFNGKVNKPLLHQVISMYLANERMGSAKTKPRGEVRGGGKKPWRQKGTGRARASSIRSPLWKGGGVVFGPIPKDWHYQLPKKMKRIALISSLNAKLNENGIIVIDAFKLESHKTKELYAILKKLKLDKNKLLIVAHNADENLKKAARNIEKLDLARAQDINVYQIINNEKVLMEKSALEKIEKELTKVV